MEEIYKNTLLLIHSLTRLSGMTYKYSTEPTEANAEELVNIVDKCENKFLKVKEEIVIIVKEIESKEKVEEVQAIQTKSGFLIKKE